VHFTVRKNNGTKSEKPQSIARGTSQTRSHGNSKVLNKGTWGRGVEAHIQHLINRNKKWWNLPLINNDGISKLTFNPLKIDPKQQKDVLSHLNQAFFEENV
jgi:hypothetical protein